MAKIISLTVLLMSVGSYALAGVTHAPEIDANSGIAAVALLGGGLLVLQTRRRRNQEKQLYEIFKCPGRRRAQPGDDAWIRTQQVGRQEADQENTTIRNQVDLRSDLLVASQHFIFRLWETQIAAPAP